MRGMVSTAAEANRQIVGENHGRSLVSSSRTKARNMTLYGILLLPSGCRPARLAQWFGTGAKRLRVLDFYTEGAGTN